MFAGSRKGSRFIHNLLNPFRHLSGNHIQIGLYFFPFLLILELNYGIVKINEKGWYPMISTALYQKFKEEIPLFDEKIHAFEAGEMDRNTFKGISGGFGSYAQRSGGYMLRLRLPGGRISKETLRFFADEIQAHQVNLMKITTCQTIQMHNLSADSTVAIMKDALDFGIVTKGGGGDNPRNVMASPLSGVEPGETFDVLPCAQAAGEYLLSRIPDLHMPRKLKVGFSNTPANQTHATFRDLGFIAREDHTFSVYCAGGLGPNPKLGVWITDGVCPEEISYYISAMIRLFTAYGNYESRAKSRTRYLQDTLGADGIRSHFLSFVEEAKKRGRGLARFRSSNDYEKGRRQYLGQTNFKPKTGGPVCRILPSHRRMPGSGKTGSAVSYHQRYAGYRASSLPRRHHLHHQSVFQRSSGRPKSHGRRGRNAV